MASTSGQGSGLRRKPSSSVKHNNMEAMRHLISDFCLDASLSDEECDHHALAEDRDENPFNDIVRQSFLQFCERDNHVCVCDHKDLPLGVTYWSDDLLHNIPVPEVSDPDKIDWLKCITAFHVLMINNEIEKDSIHILLTILLESNDPFAREPEKVARVNYDHECRRKSFSYPSKYIEELYSQRLATLEPEPSEGSENGERKPGSLPRLDNRKFHEWCCENLERAKQIFTLLSLELCRFSHEYLRESAQCRLYEFIQFQLVDQWSKFFAFDPPPYYMKIEMRQLVEFQLKVFNNKELKMLAAKHVIFYLNQINEGSPGPQVRNYHDLAIKSTFEYNDMELVTLYDKVLDIYGYDLAKLKGLVDELKGRRDCIDLGMEIRNYVDAKKLIQFYEQVQIIDFGGLNISFKYWKYSRVFERDCFRAISITDNVHAILFAVGLLGEGRDILDIYTVAIRTKGKKHCISLGSYIRDRELGSSRPTESVVVAPASKEQDCSTVKRLKQEDEGPSQACVN